MNDKKNILQALLKAKMAFKKIPKDKVGNIPTKSGNGYSYKYAALDTVLKVVEPVLHANGIEILQPIVTSQDGKPFVRTILAHAETGEFLESAVPLPETQKSQELGAAITYMRRYALVALLGIVTEEDTDGPPQGASNRKSTPAEKQKQAAAAAIDKDSMPF